MKRLMPGPTLASLALHGVVLVALLQIRSEPAETSAFSILQVEWVRSGEGQAREGIKEEGGAPPETTAATEEPPETVPRPAEPQRDPEPAPPPKTADLQAAPMPAPTERSTAPTASEPRPAPLPEPALQAAAPEPEPIAPAVAENAEPTQPGGPPPTPSPEADLEPAETPGPALAALRLPALERAEPKTAPIPERQRKMLDRRLERWARDLPAVIESEPSITWEHDGAEYTATFTEMPAADDMGLDEVRVEIRTARSGQRLTTEMRWQRLAFSHFAQFVDRWDPQVQIHDDEIVGRFHSNSEINVASMGGVKPTFHGKVTTARDVNTTQSTGRLVRRDVFLGGLETRVGRIALPPRFLPFETAPPADGAGVHRFAADTSIVFYADGTFGSRALDAPGGAEQRRALGDAPAYLIAAEGAELEVSGVVNGKVLVFSPERIVVVDDLVYAADPREDEAADDYLGLVSNRSVEIAEPEVTGPGDLTIHGAVFAKRRFQVRGYRSRGPATLTVYGSVAAGSLSATEPRYRTRLEFDPRLETARPPRFPVTGRYELAEWDGEWRMEPLEKPDASLAQEAP